MQRIGRAGWAGASSEPTAARYRLRDVDRFGPGRFYDNANLRRPPLRLTVRSTPSLIGGCRSRRRQRRKTNWQIGNLL